MSVRTRFAPSPTGELHIGGARTVLFNYLLAKQNKGQFILRVEDTDTKRNQEEFITKQYEDLVWLGLKPDESIFQKGSWGPYRQSQRLSIYHKYIDKLLTEKKVYYCFCSSEELAHEKKEYIKKNSKNNYQYSRKCLKLAEEEIKNLWRKKNNYVIRFQVSRERNYELNDLVRGQIIFQGKDIEDFVICRSNRMPLLNFAVVIDDYLMKISHVLRGEEHLSNTAKQLVLYEVLGWIPPLFIHLSLILNEQKKKLSKRDKETNQFQLISQLRELGYLPHSIVNYLLFLGWYPGVNKEIFSLEEAVQHFNLKGLHTGGAVYSLAKLNWYNKHYIQQLEEEKFAKYAWQFLSKKYNLEPEKKEWVKQIALIFRPQLNYFQELINLTIYFFCKPNKSIVVETELNKMPWLSELRKNLIKLSKWEIEEIKITLKISYQQSQATKKEFYSLIRTVLTGREKGPELPKIIFLLGKEEIKRRI